MAAANESSGWKASLKKGGEGLMRAADKVNDRLGAKVNQYTEKIGSNSFWPVTGDFPEEIKKCASILRAFTVEGVPVDPRRPHETKLQKQAPAMMRIPPRVIKEAKGLVIFTSMRSGLAPLGGAGGNGLIVARLPDGSWSPPSGIMPFNITGGFMIGVDIYDAVLVLRTQKSVDAFSKLAKPTLGGELAVVAGPWGAGGAAESGLEAAPVLSYVKSRGLYAGVELVGQVFVARFEENARMYNYPSVTAEDILTGRMRMPVAAHVLLKALSVAEGLSSPTDEVPVDHSSVADIGQEKRRLPPPPPPRTTPAPPRYEK